MIEIFPGVFLGVLRRGHYIFFFFFYGAHNVKGQTAAMGQKMKKGTF